MHRIIFHWSAGTHTVSALDRQHYHFIVDGWAKVHAGDHTPKDNRDTADGNYAAHTYMCNTGAIGVALAAMAGAVERPFNPGRYPITEAQLDAMIALIADLCRQYGIKVTRETVLSHAEVEPTLGIKQRGKWDITWIPGMDKPGNPVQVGDGIRSRISAALAGVAQPPHTIAPETPINVPSRSVLRLGHRGEAVRVLQLLLIANGSQLKADGIFGNETYKRVRWFQAGAGLTIDGVAGPKTWAALTA